MNRTRKLIIAILATITMVIIVLILWWMYRNIFAIQDVPVDTNTNLNASLQLQDQINQLSQPSQQRQDQDENYALGLKQLAYSYADRYGSFSSDSGSKNLSDLKLLSTNSMARRLNQYVATSFGGSRLYEGYDTRSIASNLDSYSADSAQITVSTQRTHYFGDDIQADVFYQDLVLKFVKVDDSWKVDDAIWQ